MAKVGNNAAQFSGEYMIQDRDHLSEPSTAPRPNARQAEQSQSRNRQQGHGDQNASGQQGGERHRKGR
jgi:hypothetical protein